MEPGQKQPDLVRRKAKCIGVNGKEKYDFFLYL